MMLKKVLLWGMCVILLIGLSACTSKSEKMFSEAKNEYDAGNWENAIALAQETVKQYPESPEAVLAKKMVEDAQKNIYLAEAERLLRLAQEKYTAKEWDESVVFAKKLMHEYADAPECTDAEALVYNCEANIMNDKAVADMGAQKYTDAISKFEDIIEKYANCIIINTVKENLQKCKIEYSDTVFIEMKAANESKKWDDVLSLYKKFEKILPDSEHAKQAAQMKIEAEKSKRKKDINNIVTLMNDAYASSDWKNAKKYAEKLISEYGDAEEIEKAKEYLKTAEEKIVEQEKKQARQIIRVTKVFYSMNSAGGAELHFNFVNNSEKTIKYIDFGVSFYNKVGDLVKPKYDNQAVNYCMVTGPYEKGKGLSGRGWYWGPYYSWDIASVELVYLRIQYTDGTLVNLSEEQLKYVQY